METIPFDKQSMNMLHDALSATVMAIAAVLTPKQKLAVADNLARLAANAERNGDLLLETALIDLQRSARL